MSDNMEEVEVEKIEKPGVLSVLHLTNHEREILLDYLNNFNPSLNSDYLFSVFGDDDFLKFFDVFAGTNIKVPSRETMVKIVNYIKIYNYCKFRGFSEESYDKASRLFKRRINSIKRIVMKVDGVLTGKSVEVDE